jgi:hypothetical protein
MSLLAEPVDDNVPPTLIEEEVIVTPLLPAILADARGAFSVPLTLAEPEEATAATVPLTSSDEPVMETPLGAVVPVPVILSAARGAVEAVVKLT